MKKNYWVATMIVSAALTASFLVACGKSGTDSSVAPINPCPAGYCAGTYPGYPGYPGITTIGFYSQSNNPSISQSLASYNPSSLSASTGFNSLLKEAMGVCDRQDSAGYAGGYANCSSWMSGMQDITFIQNGTTASTVTLTIRAYPYISNYYGYSVSLPSATDFFLGLAGFPVASYQGYFPVMQLQATIWPVNNSQGFEIRANGPTGSMAYNKLIQIQVATGKVEDQQLNYVMYYNGAQAASGRMIRCQTQNCGLPY